MCVRLSVEACAIMRPQGYSALAQFFAKNEPNCTLHPVYNAIIDGEQ